MQIISFDFGTKKIGVAVGQTLTKTSSPLSIIFNHRNKINWPEIEEVLQAYYSLIDDCKDCPEWRVKVEKELGSTVSYLFLTMDESSRDALV